MGSQRGTASVEWTALLLLVAATFSVIFAAGLAVDVPWFARTIRCALLAGCRGEDAGLEAAYGEEAAAIVRAYAPGVVYEQGTLTLPVDFRTCRRHRCSDAPDARGAHVGASRAGRRATVFTHVVDRRASGGDLFIQYWLYYPDSTYNGAAHRVSTTPLIRDTPLGAVAGKVAGRHADDWESYQLRITPRDELYARASAHHGYAGRRRWPNLNEVPTAVPVPRSGGWTRATGWTRVSRGSHAGHVVGGPGPERRTEADALALVPIEGLSAAERALSFAVTPPWQKPVYSDPGRKDT